MSESVLKSILEESAQLEWAKYDSVPEHTFSRKHCRSMRRIFRQYDNKHHSYGISNSSKRIRITRKTALILVLIVFLTTIAGCAVAYFISQNFRGSVYNDSTELFAINIDNCPSIIEEKYYLPDLSDRFDMLNTNSTPFYQYTSFENKSTGQILSFIQYVKSEFTSHFNTENQDFEEIEINGYYGLCLNLSSNENFYSVILWDNDDYIFELSGDLPKSELIDLAKTAKVFEN